MNTRRVGRFGGGGERRGQRPEEMAPCFVSFLRAGSRCDAQDSQEKQPAEKRLQALHEAPLDDFAANGERESYTERRDAQERVEKG